MPPPLPLRTRIRLAGPLPWLLIGPALLVQVAVLASAVSDAASPWPEARLAIAERRPHLALCTSISSRQQYVRGDLIAGLRTRGYILILPGGRVTSLVVSQTLPEGEVTLTDGPAGLLFPFLVVASFVAGFSLLIRRLAHASRVSPPGAIPPPPAPSVVTSTIPTREPAFRLARFLYPAGYFAAWFALVSWIGIIIISVTSIPPEGYVSTMDESPLVATLSLFFSLSLLASWALSIVLWVVLAQRRSSSVLTILLLSCTGYLWSFAYLFAALPRIRPPQFHGKA